ncbi:DUF5951 family protein [Leclercia adecarboxylata]|uniref:DUF5951 family protein n=1 Tax=Leclercia adecarboxylata TaxID=83655 RepID=UPI003305FF44
MERYLSGEKTFVKPDLRQDCSTADSVISLSSFPGFFCGKYFAGSAFLPHYLKCSFNFLSKVHFERHLRFTPGRDAHALV